MMQRIYVNLSTGESIFYDIQKQTWGSGPDQIDVERLNIEELEAKCMEKTRTRSMEEFGKYRK